MAKEILLPSLTADFEGGVIEEWHKKPGDRIAVGDILADVSTDKAVIELEAEESGTLGEILVAAGPDEVPVNTPIALLLQEGDSPGTAEAAAPAVATAEKAPVEVALDIAQTATAVAEPGGNAADKGNRILASPVAARIAEQLGVDLGAIEGSGPDGRIVLGDVEAAAADGRPILSPAATQPARPASIEMPPPGTYTREPADKVRAVIARRLGEAKREIPHFYLTVDCEIDRLLDARGQLNGSAGDAAKVSVNDFIVKACAMALREVPDANTGWADNSLLRFNDVDVAVAVATPKGLITPVVRRADTKDLPAIAVELKELASRARAGRLKPEEYKGGGFTVSNLGMYGVREFAAIINPPQSCILAVGAGEQRPVARDGQVAIATVMSCTLSVDHRAVDGALGAQFLQAVKKYIEQPGLMDA